MPTPTKYTYSIANDFPATGLDSGRLVVDIAASSIVTALDRIDTSGDVCDIWFKDELSAGDKTVLDGDAYGPAGGLIAAHTGQPLVTTDTVDLNVSQTGDSRLRVAFEKTTIDRKTLFSHNWCDRTTWYTESVRVVDEVAIDSGNQIKYDLVNPYVIDTYHGKLTEEDYLADSDGYSYRVSVKVNDQDGYSEQDPHYGTGGDFVVNYEDGYIEFTSALDPADEVTVTYHYENGSMCKFKPASDETFTLVLTELQFSTDVILKDTIEFTVYGLADVFAPGQYPAGTMIPLQDAEKFKTMMDFYNDSVKSYPTVPALGGGADNWRAMPCAINVLDWDYVTAQTLYGAYGMEIRTSLEHDTNHTGYCATVTFYFTCE